MGEVYKAHDRRLNRTVAIKRMIAEDVAGVGKKRGPLPRSTIHTFAIFTTSDPTTSFSSISRGNRSAVRCFQSLAAQGDFTIELLTAKTHCVARTRGAEAVSITSAK
jgi:hypothetical protein